MLNAGSFSNLHHAKIDTDLVRKLIISFVVVAVAYTANAQEDTLFFKRTMVDTPVYLNAKKLTPRYVSQLYEVDKVASRKYTIGRIMLPASPIFAVSGTALAVDALIGVQRTAVIDGVPYDYKERSLPKLLLGLALVVTGGSFMEGANDFKKSAAQRYNEVIKSSAKGGKTAYRPKFRITETGNVAFRLEF